MSRHTYIVSIDTVTGEAVAAEVERMRANALVVIPSAGTAIECYGSAKVVDAASDALRAIMLEAQ